MFDMVDPDPEACTTGELGGACVWVCVCVDGWRVSECYACLTEYDAEGVKGWVDVGQELQSV